MDKKSINRSTQQQSRANAIDCKKNSENHKPWTRNNKKREGNGTTPKNEPPRKNVPTQRGRGQVDKRQHTRGTTGFTLGGTQNSRIEDDDNEPEIGSVFVPGSKKQNLNHLLNFMYPARGGQDRKCPQPRRQFQNRPSYRHEHDLYLRAYCQFVVKEDGDYKVNLMDPDIPVKWEQIEEIVVRSNGKSECPICLGPPVAGRVGPCGHVHCWPCVLHYAHAHDKQPPPCPVCATPLHVADMKPALMHQWDSSREEVTMRLVRRLRGSTTVEIAPVHGQIIENCAPSIMPLDSLKDAPYCKLFSANKKQVQDIMEREKKEIENQIYAEIDTSEIVFLEQALDMLKQKEQNLSLQYEQPKIENDDNLSKETPIVYQKQEVCNDKLDWFDVTEEGAAVDVVQNKFDEMEIKSELNAEAPPFIQKEETALVEFPVTDFPVPDDVIENVPITEIDKQNQAKYFYFYQAVDGQQVFLNSLNVRILNASWGALVAAPSIIRGRVLHRETFPLVEQTRKHMPYTAHLPLYCAFDIVELDLQPPYVTSAAIQGFKEELDRRARTRARHERDERRRERAYRRLAEGPPKPDFFSEVLFPPAATVFPSSPPDSGQVSTTDQMSPSPSTSVGSPSSSGPSFAKMASTSGIWRVRKGFEAQPPPPPPEEEQSSAPRTLSLSDAIEAALLAAPSPSGKKNKKSKHKLLFATGMQHAS